MTHVAYQLEGDPGLNVKVLKTVNSAAFGLSTRVSNLHHAVTLLGRSRLETIVLPQAVNNILPSVDKSRHIWEKNTMRKIEGEDVRIETKENESNIYIKYSTPLGRAKRDQKEDCLRDFQLHHRIPSKNRGRHQDHESYP